MDNLSVFEDFLLSKEFKPMDNNKESKAVKYELNGFFVKIVQERLTSGEMGYYIDLSNVNSHNWEGWYGMDVIRCLILHTPYVLDRNMGFNELSHFFMDRYSDIFQAFKSSNFQDTEAKIAALYEERGKAMFGGK